MPVFPPTAEGITPSPPGAQGAGPPMGGLLKMLMGGMGGDDADGGTGLDAMRDAVASLHKAARLQPQLADRIEQALGILEGTGGDEDAPPGTGDSNSLPPFMTANAKTPV